MTRGIRLPRVERRQQLLTAAQQVFVETGFHAASMDEIAAKAGVTKPVLYQHFGSKRDLYLAVLDSGARSFLETMQVALESTHNNRDRVQAAIAAYLDFMSREDAAYRLVFESDLANAPDVRERVERVEDIAANMVTKLIADDTGLSDDEASLLAYGLLGLANSAAQRFLTTPGHLDPEDAATVLAALAWRGISGFPKSHPPKASEQDSPE
jgi:AcrR family transcriptional regulator